MLASLAGFSAPADARAPTISTSLSDADALVGSKLLATQLRVRKPELCVATQRPRKLGYRRALRSAERLVRANGGRKGVRRLAKSRDGRRPARAVAAAAGALGAGKPHGALAALLRAHRLRPRDPGPLISASAVLVNLGRPNEADALLRRVGGKRVKRLPSTGAFDIRPAAQLANNRGHALLAQGRWAAAERQLAVAAKRAPRLREAKFNLAHAQLCQDEDAKALRTFMLAARRSQLAGKVVGDPVDGITQVAPAEVLDLSGGVDPTLRGYKIPATSTQGRAMRASYIRLQREQNGRARAAAEVRTPARAELNASLRDKPAATKRRTRALIRAAASAGAHDPHIAELSRAFGDAQLAEGAASDAAMRGVAEPDCSPAARERWYRALLAYDKAIRELMIARYRYETGIAANLKNPAAHAFVVAEATWFVEAWLSNTVDRITYFTLWDETCTSGDPPQVDPAEGTDVRPVPPRCATGVEGPGFHVHLLILTFAVDCESVSGEVSAGLWIGAFVQVKHTPGTGSTTIFGGPKGQLNPTGFGPNATVKDGIYITFGADGGVQDVGVRVEHGADISLAGTGVPISGGAMSWSFVGVSAIAGTGTLQ